MAAIFLSYRRSDSPQACRVYEWLAKRFGTGMVFIDIADIPFAVDFPNHLREAISRSSILVALIGDGWHGRVGQGNDFVRLEIEAALERGIPVLPVLIGNAPMPEADKLPPSIARIASQNALRIGVSLDFDTHMRAVVSKIEEALGALSSRSMGTFDDEVIQRACEGVSRFLADKIREVGGQEVEWGIINTHGINRPWGTDDPYATLFLHRVVRLAELLELHFILSFWAPFPGKEHILASSVIRELELSPLLPNEYFTAQGGTQTIEVKVRHSDEDARQVWKMITDKPLQLSLAYIATVSPKSAE